MKKTNSLSCLFVFAFALAVSHFFSPSANAQDNAVKIGLVDMERIFGEFYKTKLAEEEVEKTKAIIQKEVEQRRAKHTALLKEFEPLKKKAQDPTLGATAKQKAIAAAEAKAAELRALDEEMIEYSKRRRQQLIKQVEAAKAKILDEMAKAINEIGKAEGFDAVFDRGGLSERGFPFVVFVKDANDLSEKVIKNLNANAPATLKDKKPGKLTPE